jgi:hypothetical protein
VEGKSGLLANPDNESEEARLRGPENVKLEFNIGQ